MTELLYQTNAYLHSFEATVVAQDAPRGGVVLDRTAFYPGGGGQPPDLGELEAGGRSVPVTAIVRAQGAPVHVLDGELPAPGTRVAGALDWNRRFQLMRTHTALHILCGVVWRDLQAQVTGGNMSPLSGRLDFELESLPRELVEELEAKVNEEVEAARQVEVKILPRAEAFAIPDLIRTKINLLPPGIEEVRTVEIVGLDLQADGGTHVANTREVGTVRLVDWKSKGRINKRIQLALEP